MKKYKKVKNKTPLNKKNNDYEDINDGTSRSKDEMKSDEEFIYVLTSKIKNNLNSNNDPEMNDDMRETLKRKNKSIDIATDHNQNRTGLLDLSPKKPKKKMTKRKKKSKSKSKKKEIKNNCENTVKKTENEENPKNEEETPTPNGNDADMEYFYLIDYQTKEKEREEKERENNKNKQDITPKDNDEEENYHTFHEHDSKETPDGNSINPNNTEKKKKYNFQISSVNSSNGFSNNKVNIKTKSRIEVASSPEKINFEEIEVNDNDKDNRPYKLKKIRFREKKEKREKKENKEIEEDLLFGKRDDKNDDNSNIKNENKYSVIYKQMPKKRKKIVSKKKTSAKISKIILIQSMWKKYKIKKLVDFYRKINKFISIFDKFLKEKLKQNLLYLFEQINLNDNRSKKSKGLKKPKKRKFKIKNSQQDLDEISGEKNEKTTQHKNSADNYIENYETDKNGSSMSNILLEDRKLFINNDNNIEIDYSNTNDSNTYTYENNVIDTQHLFNSMNIHLINSDNNLNNINLNEYDKKKIDEIIAQNKKELSLKNIKIKSKLKQFKIGINKKSPNENLSNSIDKVFSPQRKSSKFEAKNINYNKVYVKPIEKTSSFKKMSISKNRHKIYNKNINDNNNDDKTNLFSKKFPNENQMKCINKEMSVIDNNQKNQCGNYYTKEVCANIYFKNKSKMPKNDFSSIKFILTIKDILSYKAKKNNLKNILNYLKTKSLLLKMANIFHNKRMDLMKNEFHKFRLNTQILKFIEKYQNNELMKKKSNLKISQNKYISIKNKKNLLFNENCIESNELSITPNIISKKEKLRNQKIKQFDADMLEIENNSSDFEIIKQDKNKKLIIDKAINKFSIKQFKQNKFDDNKLFINKDISDISFICHKKENKKIDLLNDNKFTINRSYKKETEFNDNKLIITKAVSQFKINKLINNEFIIQKVSKFNIKGNYKKKNELVITKLIKTSPFSAPKRKKINNNLVISKIINNLKYKGILKKNKDFTINKVNNDDIIDDINKYIQNNKKKFYQSLIKRNSNNLAISKINNLNLLAYKKKNNNIVCKQIKNKILGNNSLEKNLYEFNHNKLIITKVNNYYFKNKGDIAKRQLIYSSSLSKIRNVILSNIKKYIYPKLINMMKRYSFCIHICKFKRITLNLLKIIFINNLKNNKLEEKYKKLYANNKFNTLIINKVIKHNYLSDENNNLYDDRNTIIENAITSSDKDQLLKQRKIIKKINQIPKHYIIHKVKLFSMNNNNEENIKKNYEEKFLEKLYEKKNKNFIKGNVITKKINLFIGNNNQEKRQKDRRYILPKENNLNIQKSINKNDNKLYYSNRFKMSNTNNQNDLNKINTNTNSNTLNNNLNNKNEIQNPNRNITYNKIQYSSSNSTKKSTSYNYSLIYNSRVYHRKSKDDHFIKKVRDKMEEEIKEAENDKLKRITEQDFKRKKGKYGQEEEIQNKEKTASSKKNKEEQYKDEQEEEESNSKFKYNDDEEEEEEEIEEEVEEEEESVDFEQVKEILIKYINKKSKILNEKLLRAFQKWKRFRKYNSYHRFRRHLRATGDDICENGGINKSRKIFLIYRKYADNPYILKRKYLIKWKKIVEEKRIKKENYAKNEIEEQEEEEEIEEFEDDNEEEDEDF